MADTYTYAQIGQRAMERNPDAFKGLNVTPDQVGQRIVQRNPQLKSLLNDTSLKTQDNTPSANQQSQDKTKSTFQANPNGSVAGEAAKVVGNLPSSAFQFAKGAVDMVNPVSTAKKVTDAVGAFSGLKADKAAEAQGNQNVADVNNKLIEQYKTMKAAGKDTSHLEAFAKQNNIDLSKVQVAKPTSSAVSSAVKELPGAAVTSIVPEAGRATGRIIQGAFTGNQKMVDENIQRAERSVVNDPVGSIAPFLLAAEGGAKILDKKGITTDASGALDRAMAKPTEIIKKVTDPIVDKVSAGASAVKGFAGKATKFGISQATGLNPDTISEVVNNPENFTKEARGSIDRSSLGQEVQSALGKRAAALEETGKEYQPIRDLKQIDKSVADITDKTVKSGKNTMVFDLKDMANDKLSLPELRKKAAMLDEDKTGTYTKAERGAVQDLIDKKSVDEPISHQVKMSPNYLDRTIKESTGLTMKDGKFETSGAAKIRDIKDVRALQNLYDTWKPSFEKGHLTTEEFLNFRSDLAKLSKFDREISKSMPLEDLAKQMRKALNDNHRAKIPGLEALDESFSKQKGELKELSHGLVDKDGNITDAGMAKIANLSKNKPNLAAQLEQIVPGISGKIKTLQAITDIERASGIKVGTYGRVVGAAFGFASAGILGAVVEAVLTSPDMAVPLLRKYGMLKDSNAVKVVMSSLKAGKNLVKAGATAINELPSKTPQILQKDVADIPVGLSVKDVSKTGGVELSIPEATKGMKVMSLDKAMKQFEENGSVTVAEGKNTRLIVKDEGDYVKIGMDNGSLSSTDTKFPSKTFATKEEAFAAIQKALDKNKPSAFSSKSQSEAEITGAQRDAIGATIKQAEPEIQDMVNTKEIGMNEWAKMKDIADRIEKGKETQADLKYAARLLKDYGFDPFASNATKAGFETKPVGSKAVEGEVLPKQWYEKNGQNLLDIENADLTLPELKDKLKIAQEGNEDMELVNIIKRDIKSRSVGAFSKR